MKPIVTLTLNPAIDGASEAEVVRPTHKIRTSNESYDPGGGGINVTRVVRELGGESVAVYLGGGATGTVLDELLGSRGIARRRIPIQDHTRVAHVVYERSTGLEYRFIPEGPLVHEREWRRCLAALDDLEWDWLVASGSLPRGVPPDFYAILADHVAARGGNLVLDTSGEALRVALDHGGLALVKPSQGEFEKYLGRTLDGPQAIADAARGMVAAGKAARIAVTLGHEGAVLATADRAYVLPAPAVKVISASGAGDSFVAGMVHALSLGAGDEEAFRTGVAAGSAAVMTVGTRLCRKEDVEEILGRLRT